MVEIEELIKGHRDAINVRRVYGDPFERNGVTVIPAAKVLGGGGGGAGRSPEGEGEGSGSGFGLMGKPVGAYVITGNDVKWMPALDVNRIIAGVFAVAALAMVLKARR